MGSTKNNELVLEKHFVLLFWEAMVVELLCQNNILKYYINTFILFFLKSHKEL